MEKIQLKAQKRTVTGRKVKKLRKDGIVPGNIFGKKISSQAVSVDGIQFSQTYKKAGETQIVELLLDNEVRPVLIQNVHINPLTDKALHADFYQVNLKEKIKTNVPVELTGESPAVATKTGLLLQTLNEIEVEALPTDLPDKLTVDVSALTQVDQELKVSDIKVPTAVTILTDKNLSIVKVGELVSKEAEELAKQEEAAAAEAKAASATEAGAAPATPASATPAPEGTPKAEGKTEASPKAAK